MEKYTEFYIKFKSKKIKEDIEKLKQIYQIKTNTKLIEILIEEKINSYFLK